METSRRSILKGIAAAGAGVALGVPASGQRRPATTNRPPGPTITPSADTASMRVGDMLITFDKRFGTLYSIQHSSDPLKTNFIGNPENTPGLTLNETAFTGDVLATVWNLTNPDWATVDEAAPSAPSGSWKSELTGESRDVRRINATPASFSVAYETPSAAEHGISSFKLLMNYHAAPDGSLMWDIDIQNATNNVLEIGELGLPLMVNNNYAEILGRKTIESLTREERTPFVQQRIHEEKVIAHSFVAGHSSYVLVQRPAGNGPFLLVHPTGDTAFECVYKHQSDFAAHVRAWESPDVLAVYSKAVKEIRRWDNWVNGHTSVVLRPGEHKTFHLRFVFIGGYDAIRDELSRIGNLGIRILPSMVVQEGTEAHVDVKCQQDLDAIETGEGDHIALKQRKRVGEHSLLTFAFEGDGQKTIRLRYAGDKWTNLHFYCVRDIESLIQARSQFIANRQFYRNPLDPFHRNHMFMPFDASRQSIFTDSDEVWEVGGSDEFGFSEPLFLAEKNVHLPSRAEIEVLETYVNDCLFQYIQNPETYYVRASLYWKSRTPSSPWGDWSKKRSEATWRTYNYPHPANIYHALYVIGLRYGLVTRRPPKEYLRMAYQTCMKWFTTGQWKHVGLMCGSNAINILDDIKREGWNDEYESLRSEMQKCNDEFVRDPYPYSSELLIDQTAHEQVYFFTHYFGNEDKAGKTLRVIEALRGGDQPVWFRYGNDKRGDMACWYSESLNGIALLNGYEDSNDPEMLLKGYAGLLSVAANLRADGMGFGWFISTPGSFGHKPPRTLDNGIGQWGFFRGAKSYVVDDQVFGTIGCGCSIAADGHSIDVTPKDGLRKRLRFVSAGIDLSVHQGQMKAVTYQQSPVVLRVSIEDSTGVSASTDLVVRGLPSGSYSVSYGSHTETVQVTDELTVRSPMPAAQDIRIEQRR